MSDLHAPSTTPNSTSILISLVRFPGWFVGNVLFLAFESVDFSNTYVRPLFGLSAQTHGLLTIDSKTAVLAESLARRSTPPLIFVSLRSFQSL